MSDDYPRMLDSARKYRDKKLCPDCRELQKEVDRLRQLIRESESAKDSKS